MSRGHSFDLRERAIALIEGGMSRRAAARQLLVSESSSIKWFRRYKETGSFAEKPGKPHGGALRRFADRLGVGHIVLLPLDERLHIGWRDHLGLMTKPTDLTRLVMGAATRLHGDRASG